MVHLTKKKAKELDILFKALSTWKGEKSLGYIDVTKVVATINELSHLDRQGIHDLIYIARIEQKKVSELFRGDTLLAIDDSSLRDFLSLGGFEHLYIQARNARRRDNFRFWSIFIVTVITLIITMFPFFHGNFKRGNLPRTNGKNHGIAKDSVKATKATKHVRDSTGAVDSLH